MSALQAHFFQMLFCFTSMARKIERERNRETKKRETENEREKKTGMKKN